MEQQVRQLVHRWSSKCYRPQLVHRWSSKCCRLQLVHRWCKKMALVATATVVVGSVSLCAAGLACVSSLHRYHRPPLALYCLSDAVAAALAGILSPVCVEPCWQVYCLLQHCCVRRAVHP